ncbi:MAG TPA: PAS domain S-box protein [Candidatus Acidoferrales bacterium]|nr:PAS domain S-box protein [Candidatus Acidoferrales bacterium]
MLYEYVSIGYSATNLLLAVIIYLKATRSLIVKFYLFLVSCLIVFGACGFLSTVITSNYAIAVTGALSSFLFALFPFFFLHFMIIMVRREELLQSPLTVAAVYFAGLFSYTLELIGLIPKPTVIGVGLSSIGYVFLVTWMSVAFSIGIAILFTFLKGFSEKGTKSNLIVGGFACLLLLLPGPFTESIFNAFFPKNMELYIFTSLLSLVVALYFVFRHKIIINTLYDAMKSALTFMSDVLFRMDDDLNIQFVRGGSLAVLGYQESELLGKNLLAFTQQGEAIRTYKENAIGGKEDEVVVDVDFVSKSGNTVPMNLSLTIVLEAGQTVGFVGVGRDITERRRSELLQAALVRLAEITRVTDNLNEFCKAIHEVVAHLIPAKNFYIALRDSLSNSLFYPYYVNEVFDGPEKQPGLDAFNEQAALSGSPSILTVNESSDMDTKEAGNAVRKMPVDWLGVPLKTASGTIGVLGIQNFTTMTRFSDREKNLLSLLSGQIAAAIERKRSDEKIREQATLLDKSQDAITLETLDGIITYWNEGATKIFGWKSEDAIGKKLESLMKDKMPQGSSAARNKTLKESEWAGEMTSFNRSGDELILDCRWKLLTDIEGNPRTIMTICTDITDRKKLESQFMRAQRLESIGTLAGGIAHDLNNVLSPIMMSVRALKRRLNDDQSEKILQAIESSAKRGADMVRQVLMFGRGAKGERVILQPRHVVREIVSIANETLPKSIRVDQYIPKDLWTILGDATQLHQVLLNLCVNARDAMSEGGVLTLSAENTILNEESAKMNIDAKPGKYVLIAVSDTGVGIPPGLLDKIFEPFFTTKEVGKGTGLGLSTALAIVKAHGGFINVFSEINKGTSFKIYLPATELEEVSTAVETDLDQYVGHGEMILVVDDESSIREIARATLEAYHYQVVLAGDGAEAIAVFVKNMEEVRAVIIDNMMPILDGKSAVSALKRMETEVKIIATSGLQEEASAGFAGQIDAFISKPFTGEKLLKTVYEVLNED